MEDLAQAPCSMLSLEVLQSFPNQRNELFSSIHAVDPNDTSLITFDLEQSTSRLPSHVTFQVKVLSHGMNIFELL